MKTSASSWMGWLVVLASAPAQAGTPPRTGTPPQTTPPSATWVTREQIPDLAGAAAVIYERVDAQRHAEGLGPLRRAPQLEAAARYFADFMAEDDRYGHAADGSTPGERAARFGYESCIVAENIAAQFLTGGFTTEELGTEFIEGWLASVGHRRNILDPDLRELGLAIARSAKTGTYYAVQVFGRPRTDQVEFSLRNTGGATVAYRLDGVEMTLAPATSVTHQRCRPPRLALAGGSLTALESGRYRAERDPQGGWRLVQE